MRKPIVHEPATLVLFDDPIKQINTKLSQDLDWVDQLFGKSQRMIRPRSEVYNSGARGESVGGSATGLVRFPAVYKGKGGDYVNLLPREDLGNFVYWDLGKEYEVEEITRQRSVVRVEIGIVFFMNLRKILPTTEEGNLEMLKVEVLDSLQSLRVPKARLMITGITEDADKVYSGYNVREVEDQFRMYPFAVFRINGELRWERLC